MKSLFSATDSAEIINRINRLAPDATAQWGKMDVAQMLTHTQPPIKVAFGELKLKRTLIGILFGGIAKKKLTSEKPWKKNLPTDKNFVVADTRNFSEEQGKLVSLVQRFTRVGPGGISKEPHPFFGHLSPDEWGWLMWKHLDHHLKQFGG